MKTKDTRRYILPAVLLLGFFAAGALWCGGEQPHHTGKHVGHQPNLDHPLDSTTVQESTSKELAAVLWRDGAQSGENMPSKKVLNEMRRQVSLLQEEQARLRDLLAGRSSSDEGVAAAWPNDWEPEGAQEAMHSRFQEVENRFLTESHDKAWASAAESRIEQSFSGLTIDNGTDGAGDMLVECRSSSCRLEIWPHEIELPGDAVEEIDHAMMWPGEIVYRWDAEAAVLVGFLARDGASLSQ